MLAYGKADLSVGFLMPKCRLILRMKSVKIIRYSARFLGTLWVLFMAYFVLFYVLGIGGEGMVMKSTADVITFLVYPMCTLVGLSIAWKWEGVGSAVTVLANIGLLVFRPELAARFYLLIPLLPGALYLLLFFNRRREQKS